MSHHVYKQVEVTGTSEKGVEDAVQNALAKASETIRNLRWFEVSDIRGAIQNDRSPLWQVTMKIGFTLDD